MRNKNGNQDELAQDMEVYNAGDTIGIALDCDAREIVWYKNWQQVATITEIEKEQVYDPAISMLGAGQEVKML